MWCVLPFDAPAAGLPYNWRFRRRVAGLVTAIGRLGRAWVGGVGGTAAFAAACSVATANLAACVISSATFTNAVHNMSFSAAVTRHCQVVAS